MVKILVNNQELDLYGDETIELNKSVKRLRDIGSVYTPYTQSFTVPASRTNNQIFKHYYRDDLNENVSNLFRIPAVLTLAGQIFEQGSIQVEGASMSNGLPQSYRISFYGAAASLNELAGDDSLRVLDLSTYDHEYGASVIQSGLDGTGLSSGDIIYPLFSPVRRWVYNSDSGAVTNNIAWAGGGNTEGVNYFELKPAIKVTKLLDAIEAYYDITFSGSFLTSEPFTQTFLWLHNREGYIYEGQDDLIQPSTNREVISGLTKINTSSSNPLGTDISDGIAKFYTTGSGATGGVYEFRFDVTFSTLSDDAVIYLTQNGTVINQVKATATSTTYQLSTSTFPANTAAGRTFEVFIGKTTANLTYQCSIDAIGIFRIGGQSPTSSTQVTCTMSSSVTNTEDVVIGNLVPDITITNFLNGLIKQYNLIVTSTDGSTYTFETRDTYYGAGEELDLDRWLDTQEVEVTGVPVFKALNFVYEQSDQYLQKQYRAQNGRGYADLVQAFNFDSREVYNVEVPFDHLFTEKLTNAATGTDLVDFTIYQSIEIDENSVASSYYGAPVLFYVNETIDISANSIAFIDESSSATEVDTIFFCEDVSSTTATDAESSTFSQEINPYLEQEPDSNLYSNYWSNQITNTYDSRTRVYSIEANINLGLLLRLDLNDTVLWRGRKYLINEMRVDLATGRAKLELVTKTV